MVISNWITPALRDFLRQESGSTLITFGIMIVVILTMAGAALDFASARSHKSGLQEVLDAAVLAGLAAGMDKEDQIAAAEKHFHAHFAQQDANLTLAFTHDEDGQLIGTAATSVETSLLKLAQIDKIDVAADSIGSLAPSLAPVCFMAMHPTRKHTLELKGTVSVYGPDCHFYGNSDHPDDVVDPHNSENYLTGKSVQAIGYGHHFLQNVTPPLEYAPYHIPDAFSSMALPEAGPCDHDRLKVQNQTVTLSPGTFCNGLHLQNSTVTLEPGLYIITDRTFKLFNSTLTGTDVTIMLEEDVELDWNNSIVRLTAPKTGTYKSMVLMGVREESEHSFNATTLDLHGVVYLPNGEIDWSNAGTPTINAKWTVWIIDGVSWSGSGTIAINFKPEESDVPYPGALNNLIPREGRPRLVE